MSNRAINAVLDHSKTKSSTRLLMLVIADGIGKDTNVYRARIATLMRDCNCSEPTVHRMVRSALKSGELIVIDNPGHASHFAIPLYPGEPGYAPEECHSDTHTCNKHHTPLDITREDARNADDYRRRKPQGGVRIDTRRGVVVDTPHQQPRKGVSEMTPPGVTDDTPPVSEMTPPGVTDDTQYPSGTPFIKPIDVPGAIHPSRKEKEKGTTPKHQPTVTPITEIRRDVGDTLSPPVARPPSLAHSTWRRMREELDPRLSPIQRKEWFDRLELYRLEGNDWVLIAPTKFGAEHVQNNWGEHLRKALEHVAGPDAQLLITTLQKGAHV